MRNYGNMTQFSNERFSLLTDQEINEQRALLMPLREKHERELYKSGTVGRLLASTAISNKASIKDPITEGSSVYPFRRKMGSLQFPPYADLCRDIGLSSDLNSSTESRLASHVFYVARLDAIERGSRGTHYVAGALLNNEEHEAGRYMPVPGILEDDLKRIEEQLAEVEAFARQHLLPIVDPVMLAEGIGEIVTW